MPAPSSSPTNTSSAPRRLEPGDPAPALTLPDHTGKTVSLEDFAGRRVLVYFYPKAGTPGCTKEACDFRDNLSDFTDLGITVLGVSPDSPDALAAFREDESLPFTLLSDESKETMAAWGAWGEKKNYGRVVQGIIRSTIIIGTNGRVESAQYNVRATGHVARVLRDL
ncbi:thioredoxin-dependent thiol peroxidase [Corynebacterium sp. CCM 8835]|uniref:thioredoxin-dependent peroxiredoxin n=1 Tax=Corynebacterium antarcticum TaxID=2800405 RepID=A0ABS1FHR3_9CORY|nr:thioredoxin-dependent thiol peroxidase [Corynebacterium antarcticum]MCK7642064.1 thioredoxin-dependent thiol peroxidase [Corynebacterium antarcticum]MCL0245289.1 thioredoxin-dependent thiol peroxidase [Corynebacterium antarcticum]MCX7539162.1 thioredoxin-dependent thiol peroxidase [Corynebacterium antarcticum]